MKQMKIRVALMTMTALLATGCAQEKSKPQPSSVLDVRPAPQPQPQSVQPGDSPQPVQPMPVDTPSPRKPVKASASSRKAPPPVDVSVSGPASSPAGQSYTVQKGDTLFGIAKKVYGDGTKWNKIAQANPGVSPMTLKVGQTLTIPQ